jgi:hypothetical protein
MGNFFGSHYHGSMQLPRLYGPSLALGRDGARKRNFLEGCSLGGANGLHRAPRPTDRNSYGQPISGPRTLGNLTTDDCSIQG